MAPEAATVREPEERVHVHRRRPERRAAVARQPGARHGLQRVARLWGVSRATIYRHRHHLDDVRWGEWMVKVLSSLFHVAVVSSPRTFEPWPSSVWA